VSERCGFATPGESPA